MTISLNDLLKIQTAVNIYGDGKVGHDGCGEFCRAVHVSLLLILSINRDSPRSMHMSMHEHGDVGFV